MATKEAPNANSEQSKDATLEVITSLLNESGVPQYDPEVVTHLADYMDFYITKLLEQATSLMKHANRTEINKSDIDLARELVEKKAPTRISRQELIDLAREHNKTKIPEVFQKVGVPIPNNGIVLQEANCRMKSPYSNKLKYPINYPLMDLMNRQNQMYALNAMKNQQGLTTVLRPPIGHPSMAVNLTPQRIVIKPKMPTTVNIRGQNKVDERRLKFYEMPKK